MFKRIRNNFKYSISRFWLIASIAFGVLSGVEIFIDWDIIGIEDIGCRVFCLLSVLILCMVVSIVWGAFCSNTKTIYTRDEVRIEVKYENLMRIAFPKKRKKDRIVVIAVNRCFDMVVNQDLIYEGSIHGQFLKSYVNNDATKRAILETKIKESLAEFNYVPDHLERKNKRYGNLERYPLGSVARVNGENGVTFFLLALTEFDKDCRAHCDKHQYVECLLRLFEYYDAHGQGMELYLYPMGTGMARTGLSKKEALETVVLLTKLSKEHLRSKTTIVVDKRCKNEISITDI